jgi:hypothetical protein
VVGIIYCIYSPSFQSILPCPYLLYIFFFFFSPPVNIGTLLVHIYTPAVLCKYHSYTHSYTLSYTHSLYPLHIPTSYTQHTYPHSNFDTHFYLFLFKGIGVHLLDISRGGRDCLIPFHCKGPEGVHLLDISCVWW